MDATSENRQLDLGMIKKTDYYYLILILLNIVRTKGEFYSPYDIAV